MKMNQLKYEYVDNVKFGLSAEKEVKEMVRKTLHLLESTKLKMALYFFPDECRVARILIDDYYDRFINVGMNRG